VPEEAAVSFGRWWSGHGWCCAAANRCRSHFALCTWSLTILTSLLLPRLTVLVHP